MSTPYEGLQYGGLSVLTTLSGDVGIVNFQYESGNCHLIQGNCIACKVI